MNKKKKDLRNWFEAEPAHLFRLFSEKKTQALSGQEMLLEICHVVLDSAGDSIYLVNRDLRYIYVNRTYLERIGLPMEDVIGRAYGEFHTKKRETEFRNKVEEAFASGKPIQHEHRSERDDRQFLRTFSPVKDPSDEKIVGVTVISKDITDFKQIEKTIQESEQRYRTLFNSANDAVFIMRDDTFIDCNTLTLKMFGCTTEQIIGRPPYVFSPPLQPDGRDSKEKAMEKIHLALSGKPQFFYWKHCRYDGTLFDVEVSLNSVRVGDEVLIQAIVRDITTRKHAEESLRETQQKLENIISFLPDPTLVIDRDGRVIAWNRAMESLTGIKAEEMLGKGDYEYALPFYGERRPLLIDLALQPAPEMEKKYTTIQIVGDTLFGEAFTPALSSGNIHLSATASVLRDSKGEIIGAIECIRDDTARKLAEKALRESEEKYRNILGSIEDGCYEVDLPGNFTFVNPSMSRILGYSEEELIGMNNRHYLDKEGARGVFQTYNAVYKTGIPSRDFDLELIRKDGSKALVGGSVALKKDSSGNPIGFRGILHDVTERKQAEEALRKTYQDLQDTKVQLIQQGRLAALGQLASGAAHEIRNPLNIMSLRLQLMEMQGIMDQNVQKTIDVCKAQMSRILHIVEGLRTFSLRPEKKVARHDINTIIEKVLNSSAPRFKAGGISIEVVYATDLPPVWLDSNGVERVILNLVSNALDAMKDQERRILRVTVGRHENNVRIMISDTGHGIKEEDLPRIFDPFFTTKGPDKGTGLGLYVAYGIIQDHEGRIWAENNEHGGAAFFAELPIENDPDGHRDA